jgi:hypothetical protein
LISGNGVADKRLRGANAHFENADGRTVEVAGRSLGGGGDTPPIAVPWPCAHD